MKYFPICIVDDDHEDQMMIQDFFSDMNLEGSVEYFSNGEKVMSYLQKIPDSAHLPKLIVLDLNMPILNGTQTLIQIKRSAELASIPVIIFSTSENEEERRKCLSYGAIDYLIKPMTVEDGQKTIQRFASFLDENDVEGSDMPS